MRKVHLVLLSKFWDIFGPFQRSFDEVEPEIAKTCVWDAAKSIDMPEAELRWMFILGKQPFQIARNANVGWRAIPRNADIVYCGDDVEVSEPTIERLQQFAYSDNRIGIASPKIDGPFNFERQHWAAFVFVYIKRSTIERVGYLDENYEGYGWEDLDYCYRTQRAGFTVSIADNISVKHKGSETFRRVLNDNGMREHDAANRKRFAHKWACRDSSPAALYEVMRGIENPTGVQKLSRTQGSS